MRKKHTRQEKILRHMYLRHMYGPAISDSRMVFVRWLIEQLDREEEYDMPQKTLEEQIRQSLYHLEKKNLVRISSVKGGKFVFRVTSDGKKYIQSPELSDVRIAHASVWDGRWRFVMFDVPRKYNYKRDIFRDKLKRAGFFRVQHSVWVFPYDCHESIHPLLEDLDIQKYVLQFVGHVRHDKNLIKYFKGKGFAL